MADAGVVMIAVPSDSRKRLWMNRPGGGGGGGGKGGADDDAARGRVRKQNVSGCRTGARLERSVESDVSPGAGPGVAGGGWHAMV